jgi:hypothetical protein
MSQPELPDPTTVVSGLPVNVPLKLASLAAGIPILFLRQELGSEALIVFLTLLSYLGPYVLIGFAPPLKRPFQVGFAAGYAFAMSVALVIYFVARSLGSPTSAAIVSSYGSGLLLNFALFTIAVITWIRLRKQIDNSATFSMLIVGLGYPLIAFVVSLIVGNLFFR